ncbi:MULTISPECIES: DUF1254 domain-containing protein [Psychrilyobacter]|uniref:DUF1254 domain-containing protein n=1 Tax=Psychrilyobacter piezotolerans TaxID=2293438 RepID=A0ABX9KDH0_9FUSO|nr:MULTISPECIES: DUF1254 domain-containing protein [Psychrilyobacter]MCS5422926.1 DUF1254 domain-containing protein [Psychrilyobacter sp. S5]NDI79076.1 DUF1254 domain-containing protein [Psychrilyobacter piezotolerans]RDE59036.1 DUF1254 domain-containing protein [Psychrilyobacter sp. S5]REI39613.1 DUF1254 domain-containing protein [Psychrilyobacter piezotolerans]
MTSREYVETESYSFMKEFIDRNGLNKPTHFKSLAKPGDNWVVSPNRDTIYTMITVKTTKGFTLKLPEMNGRFLGAQFVNADHTVPFYETKGAFLYNKKVNG